MLKKFFGSVERALELTRELLWPFNAGTWFKLCFLFALTGTGGIPGCQYSGSSKSPDLGQLFHKAEASAAPADIKLQKARPLITRVTQTLRIFARENKRAIFTLALLVGAIGILLYALFLWIGSRLKAVVAKCLLEREVRIRHFWRSTRNEGEALFAMNLVGLAVAWVPALLAWGAVGYKLFSHAWTLKTHWPWLVAVSIPIFLNIAGCALVMGAINQFLAMHLVATGEPCRAALARFFFIAREKFMKAVGYLILYGAMGIAASMALTLALAVVLVPVGIVVGIAGIALGAPTLLFLVTLFLLAQVPLGVFFGFLRLEMVGYIKESRRDE